MGSSSRWERGKSVSLKKGSGKIVLPGRFRLLRRNDGGDPLAQQEDSLHRGDVSNQLLRGEIVKKLSDGTKSYINGGSEGGSGTSLLGKKTT